MLAGASFGSIAIGSPDKREMTKMMRLAPMMLMTPCITRRTRKPVMEAAGGYCFRPTSCMLRQKAIGQARNVTVSRQANVTTGR